MAVVTKRDLVNRISEATGSSRRDVLDVIEQMIIEITEIMAAGDEMVFRNFGTFQTMVNKPKVGRNPKQPDVDIVIPERRVVKFRTGKDLKERIEASDNKLTK